jgi:hypothetical protein
MELESGPRRNNSQPPTREPSGHTKPEKRLTCDRRREVLAIASGVPRGLEIPELRFEGEDPVTA